MLFGITGVGLYAILGICSMPSIGVGMTSKQWQFVYGPIAWAALLCGITHVLIMGVKGWTNTSKWPGGMPPITMTSTLLPMFIVFLKLVQILVSALCTTGKHNKRVGEEKDHMNPLLAPAETEGSTSHGLVRVSDDEYGSSSKGAFLDIEPMPNLDEEEASIDLPLRFAAKEDRVV